MIKDKKQLRFYILADRIINGYPERKTLFETFERVIGGGKVMEYLEVLRKYEYYRNYKKRTASMKFVKFLYYRWRYDILGLKTGISIAPDTFGYGLSIPHYGSIVVGKNKIGNFAVIFQDTTISGNEKKIGDFFYLSAGAKITSKVSIGNNVSVAANSVVTKSFGDNLLIGGVPAKVLKDEYPSWCDRDGAIYIDRINLIKRIQNQRFI